MSGKTAVAAGAAESRLMAACITDKKVEEMASAMQAVCDAAKADKARLEYLELEVGKQTSRANASELEKAGLQDRVRQLEAALEEQGQKAALSWKWQQEVARLQEKLGKRSLEVLARDQELDSLRQQVAELSRRVSEEEEAHAATREERALVMSQVDQRLAEALAARDAAHDAAREQYARAISDLRQQLDAAHQKLREIEEARAASRAKYQQLSQRLDMLSRSAAAAKSLGGGSGSVGGAGQSSTGVLEAALLEAVNSGKPAAGSRGSVGIALAPMAESASAAAAGSTAGGFQSSLRWSGLSLESKGPTATGGSYRSSACSGSTTSSSPKRGGMLSRLKTSTLGAAMASLASPRASKRSPACQQVLSHQPEAASHGSGKDEAVRTASRYSSSTTTGQIAAVSSPALMTFNSKASTQAADYGSPDRDSGSYTVKAGGVLHAAARAVSGTPLDLLQHQHGYQAKAQAAECQQEFNSCLNTGATRFMSMDADTVSAWAHEG